MVIHKRPGVAITDAGLKVCSGELGLPILKDPPRLEVTLNEEHGVIRDEKDELSYKQKIEYIPSHCCTTVNLHDKYYCIRNNVLEAIWPIAGRGKSQ
jgi:D-serine deaminase-like pyridoxal phosphate-dependent protein